MRLSVHTLLRVSVSSFVLAAACPAVAWGEAATATEAPAKADAVAAQGATRGSAVEQEDVGGEIVVTARRKEERLHEVPQSIVAVNGATLDQLRITKFEDIDTLVPGLALQSLGDGFSFRATLRG